jgi:hypothetical protein
LPEGGNAGLLIVTRSTVWSGNDLSLLFLLSSSWLIVLSLSESVFIVKLGEKS